MSDAVLAGAGFRLYAELRNLHADRAFAPIQKDVERDFLPVEMHPPVADKHLRNAHQQHIPGNAPVVPPVIVEGRDLRHSAGIVYPDHEAVFPFLELLRNFEAERRETALVLPEDYIVQPHHALIVNSAEVDESAVSGNFVKINLPPVPYAAFVVVEPLGQGVPIARNLKRRGHVEVVFDEFCFVSVEMPIGEKALVGLLQGHMVLVDARVHGIHDVVPCPSE